MSLVFFGLTPENATHETLQRAYRQALQRTHPDKGGSSDKFQAVKRSYLVALAQLGPLSSKCVACDGVGSQQVGLTSSVRTVICTHCRGSGKC
jgi:DnaJ-class molecular chaperone